MPIYRDVSAGRAPGGLEFFLPLFFERTSHLFEYLPPSSVLIDMQEASSHVDGLWNGIVERHEQLRHDRYRPILDPAELYLPPAELKRGASARGPRSSCAPSSGRRRPRGPCRISRAPRPPRCASIRAPSSRPPSSRRTSPRPQGRVLLAAESAGRRELLLDLLRARGIQPKVFENVREPSWRAVSISASPCRRRSSGLRLESPPLEILTESQLFGDRARQERRRRRSERDPAKILKELSDLRIGAPVVHESYGVGRYVGLKTMDVAGYTGEFLVLDYADGDKLYVPVQALHLVSRYTGAPADTAPLHKLGGDQWQKARRKAAQRIRDVAAELLDLYSRRAAREGTSMQAAEGRLSRLSGGVSLRGDGRPGRGHRAGARGFEVGQADGPGHLRRRRLRQDRSGAARRIRRRSGGQAGGGAGADHAARPAALHHLRRSLRRLAGAHREPVALSHPEGSRGGHRRNRLGLGGYRHRHAPTACRAKCASRISGSW